MRSSPLIAGCLIACLALPAAAEAPQRGRGAVTFVGIGLTAASLVLGGMAAGAFLNAVAWDDRLRLYDPNRTPGSPGANEATEGATLQTFRDNRAQSSGLGVGLLVASGASLLLGVVALIVDGVLGAQPVAVGFAPGPDGTSAFVGLRF